MHPNMTRLIAAAAMVPAFAAGASTYTSGVDESVLDRTPLVQPDAIRARNAVRMVNFTDRQMPALDMRFSSRGLRWILHRWRLEDFAHEYNAELKRVAAPVSEQHAGEFDLHAVPADNSARFGTDVMSGQTPRLLAQNRLALVAPTVIAAN